jgi:hypothetical protein
MHLVVFDIDGTLTNTNLEDGECYWRALCELLGFSSEQPQWSEFRHVTDVGIASELCERHLHRQLTSVDVEALSFRLATLLEVALVDKNPRAYQIPGSGEILSILGKSFDFAVALATCDVTKLGPFRPLVGKSQQLADRAPIALPVLQVGVGQGSIDVEHGQIC